MPLEYVLIVMMGGNPLYVGTFLNCEVANAYADENLLDDTYRICLHQDFINLPPEHKHKYIFYDYHKTELQVGIEKRSHITLSVARSQGR